MNVSKLELLAELNGVQISFVDAANANRKASPEALKGVLKALDIPAGTDREIRDSLRQSRLRQYHKGMEPVIVAWGESKAEAVLHLPASPAGKPIRAKIQLEDGRAETFRIRPREQGREKVEGETFVTLKLMLPRFPPGYHPLEITVGDAVYRSLVLSAPERSYTEGDGKKRWGAFLPLYAAHSKESWGAGNFSDWARFSKWLGLQGGDVAATLPLMAAFLDYPVCEPSPYSPASRLFWNEFYIDIPRVPEFARSARANALVNSTAFQKNLRAFRRNEIIDYGAQWGARRKALELLAREFFSRPSPRRKSFEKFLQERRAADDYAAFRAVCDKLKTSWHTWPERLRAGELRAEDYEEATKQFHLYVQWVAHAQITELVRDSEKNGVKLYLDLPLGVNPDGYDVWRERESFALGASAGAPPDLFFSKGQDWGFAPLHPRRIRESGYRYVQAFLRFQMQQTRMLRIDHVMGLHRLYWVPHGFGPAQGTYVNYPAEELHAIFNIESHRHRTQLVGENLGTVPPAVNEAMRRHGMSGMYVVQFEETPDPGKALSRPAALSVASLNTHDTPTFAAHWEGQDLVECVRLGLLGRRELKGAKKNREKVKAAVIQFLKAEGFLKKAKPKTGEVLRALLEWLRASDSEMVLVNVEDLWLEPRPQNVPGTSSERPNWRRKARLTLEQIFRDKRLRIKL